MRIVSIYDYWSEQYKILFIFFTFSLFIVLVLLLISFLLSPKLNTFEKQTTYESGFEPLESGHTVFFNVQYFVVGILFLIFDLEIPFLYCGALCLGSLSFAGILSLLFFFLLLIIGFIYEWKKGVLDWV